MKNFREYHLEQLKNSEDAKEYLEGALETYEEDGNKEAFFKALRDVAESQGEINKVVTNNLPKSSKCLSHFILQEKPKIRDCGSYFRWFRISFKHHASSFKSIMLRWQEYVIQPYKEAKNSQ